MNERWQQMESIFHSALERRKEARAQFLAAACGEDAELRREVESLLASFDEAEDFIETPALAGAAFVHRHPVVGKRIGNYEILSELGKGGVGEVYLARDVRLDRAVALKLLSPKFTRNPSAVMRFEREARAASALNHPNIITIYETGRQAGSHFIATEFVPGQTLREKMKAGKFDWREVLQIAVQIAGGLAAAHNAHIVHRDVKPENVMVRPDGVVKVLDFGLAKPIKPEEGDNRKPGSPAVFETIPGILLGTLAYLSPEQARGEKVDHRTDLFSLGVVLYEMISGRRPFHADHPVELFDAIQDQIPQPMAAGEPRWLSAAVFRALEKDPAARYQSAEELLHDLVQGEQRSRMSSRGSLREKRWKVASILAILFAMMTAFLFWIKSQ